MQYRRQQEHFGESECRSAVWISTLIGLGPVRAFAGDLCCGQTRGHGSCARHARENPVVPSLFSIVFPDKTLFFRRWFHGRPRSRDVSYIGRGEKKSRKRVSFPFGPRRKSDFGRPPTVTCGLRWYDNNGYSPPPGNTSPGPRRQEMRRQIITVIVLNDASSAVKSSVQRIYRGGGGRNAGTVGRSGQCSDGDFPGKRKTKTKKTVGVRTGSSGVSTFLDRPYTFEIFANENVPPK